MRCRRFMFLQYVPEYAGRDTIRYTIMIREV